MGFSCYRAARSVQRGGAAGLEEGHCVLQLLQTLPLTTTVCQGSVHRKSYSYLHSEWMPYDDSKSFVFCHHCQRPAVTCSEIIQMPD